MMPRRFMTLFAIIFLFACPHAFAAGSLSEAQALDLLVATIKKDKLYDSWTTLSCLQFFTEERTKDYFDFVIHEKHEGKCPGDPNTWPVVDRFRVHRSDKKIQWHEPIEGELLPYNAVLKTRLKR